MNQKVSIVVPVYNVELFLKECLNSIINQTYKNIEIIIVNDGSTDNSYKICKDFKNKDCRIKLICQDNSGLSAARNTGINKATGEWIVFVDSDDVISLNMIEKMLELSVYDKDIDVVICKNLKFYEEINLIEEEESIEILNNIEALKNLYNQKQEFFITAWAKMYRTELFHNINFPVGKLHEDVFTTYKIYDLAKKVVYTNQAYYYYRQRQGSIMNSSFSIRKFDLLEGMYNMMLYYLNIPELEKSVNVVGEFLEKLIYFYNKSYYLNKNDGNIIREKLLKNHRSIVNKFWKNLETKEKFKFMLFYISPKIYFFLWNRVKG